MNSPHRVSFGGEFKTQDLDNFTKNPECSVSISGTMDNTGAAFTHDGRLSPFEFYGTIKGGTVASTLGNPIKSNIGTFSGCSFRDLTVEGRCEFRDGLTIEADCVLRITGDRHDPCYFINTQTLSGPGKMLVESTSDFVEVLLRSTGQTPEPVILTFSSNFTLEFSNARTVWFEGQGSEEIRNHGTISLTSDLYGEMGFDPHPFETLKLVNKGLIRVRAGTLVFNGSWSNAEGVISAGTKNEPGGGSYGGIVVLGGRFKGADIGQIGTQTDSVAGVDVTGEIDNRENTLTIPPPSYLGSDGSGLGWTFADHSLFSIRYLQATTPVITGGKLKTTASTPLKFRTPLLPLILDGLTITETVELLNEDYIVVKNGLHFDDGALLKFLHTVNLHFGGGAQEISGNGNLHFGSLFSPAPFLFQSLGDGTATGAAQITIGPGMTVHGYDDGVFRSNGPHESLINKGTLRVTGQGAYKPTVTLQNVTNQGVLQEVDGGKFLIIND